MFINFQAEPMPHEINFPAEPMPNINYLSRQNLTAPPLLRQNQISGRPLGEGRTG